MLPSRFPVTGSARSQTKYPEAVKVSSYLELARTLCIGPLKDPGPELRVIRQRFAKIFEESSIEFLEIEQSTEGVLAFLRFKETCSPNNQDRCGCRLAFDCSDPNFQRARDLVGAYMFCRPAVVHGRLWVGEVPLTCKDDQLRDALRLLGHAPDEVKIASDLLFSAEAERKKRWGLVRYASDRVAAQVLMQLRRELVTLTSLPWPIILRAWAPAEDFDPLFNLGLSTAQGQGYVSSPPHFVADFTLEWELTLEWRTLHALHRAQRDLLRKQQWAERHDLMREFSPSGEDRARWKDAESDFSGFVTTCRRKVFVRGIKAEKTNKDVTEWFSERFGTVEHCEVSQQAAASSDRRSGGTMKGDDSKEGTMKAVLLFEEYGAARKAIENLSSVSNADTPLGDLTVRHYVENATLWVGELTRNVTNQQLKNAFEQFGSVIRATISSPTTAVGKLADVAPGVLSYGVVQFDKFSVASDLLSVLDSEIFVMTGTALNPVLQAGPPSLYRD